MRTSFEIDADVLKKCRKLLFLGAGLVSSLLCAPPPAHADSITVGLPAQSGAGNCLPFGCANPSFTEFQYIYSANDFPVTIAINEIDFFEAPGILFNGQLDSGTYAVYLSTSPSSVIAPSTTFADNLGTDNALFTTLVLTGGPVPNVLSIPGGPFVYDPSMGNLLIDIQASGVSNIGDLGFFAIPQTVGDDSRRVVGSGATGTVDQATLVTQFSGENVSIVPEPGTMTLVAIGLMGVVTRARRRSRGTTLA